MKMQRAVLQFSLLLLSWMLPPVTSNIYLKELDVPTEADFQGTATLRCFYDLNGTNLYSVKWYKNEHEFFRYMPSNYPKSEIQTFDTDGVIVDQENSNKNFVVLKELSFNSSGIYKCEVSSEGPTFDTTYKQSNMTVLALPKADPIVEGILQYYSIGDRVIGNCTSRKTYPETKLKWFVNGKELGEYKLLYYASTLGPNGLVTSALGVNLEVENHHFIPNHRMELRCTATVLGHKRHTTIIAQQTRANNEKLYLGNNRGSGTASLCPVYSLLFVCVSLIAHSIHMES